MVGRSGLEPVTGRTPLVDDAPVVTAPGVCTGSEPQRVVQLKAKDPPERAFCEWAVLGSNQ